MYGRIKTIHFVGIGGIGMSGIAEVLLNMGYKVTGSDINRSSTVERLDELGAKVFIGHSSDHVGEADVVVKSSAIVGENPEISEALRRNVPVIPRAEMLAELMKLKHGIAVAGSHGKTTTTSMIASVLAEGDFDPTIVVGGKVTALGTNARLGRGKFMVAEADESDGSFLVLSPTIAVVTNIDREHMDYYGSMDELEKAFTKFLNKIPFYGLDVICADCPRVSSLIPNLKKRTVTYGLSPHAELRAEDVVTSGFRTRFTLRLKDEPLGEINLNHPGTHNAQNALAAFAVGMELGMSKPDIKEGLHKFRGIERRLQLKGEKLEIAVVDDYGHHPAEIRATLATLREAFGGRLLVIFQPHRYSRTELLFDDFVPALASADVLFVLDIYPAGEGKIPGVNSEKLVRAIKDTGHENVFYLANQENAYGSVLDRVKPNDVVITLGAGDVWKVGEKILEEI